MISQGQQRVWITFFFLLLAIGQEMRKANLWIQVYEAAKSGRENAD